MCALISQDFALELQWPQPLRKQSDFSLRDSGLVQPKKKCFAHAVSWHRPPGVSITIWQWWTAQHTAIATRGSWTSSLSCTVSNAWRASKIFMTCKKQHCQSLLQKGRQKSDANFSSNARPAPPGFRARATFSCVMLFPLDRTSYTRSKKCAGNNYFSICSF